MPIKITGRNKELFDKNLAAVLNVACVVAMSGSIPNKREIEEPERWGKYWIREKDGTNRFQLYPASNDYWANIKDEGENFIVIEFSYRYDRNGNAFSDALTQLIAVRFRDDVVVLP